MESNDPLIGKQLGTCILDRVVGAGGMGVVYLAHQTRPIRDVAVKVLRSGAGVYTDAHKEFLERFRREANVIARLDHVNILPIYGYDEQDGLAYLVMPYLTGGSLRTLLMERGKLSPQEAFKYIEQAGAALQYAHEHQIVHRDIKPANMLFHADGRLVLVDFGIARITQDNSVNELADASITTVGQILGSVEYMAPEMVHGHKVDHRTDLYELGIVLFQMLTGRVPFQGTTVLSIAAMHVNETPRSLTLLEPLIPRALDAVVQKVLSKKPEDRYNSARAFVEAVRTAISTTNPFSSGFNNYPGNQPPFSLQPNHPSNPAHQATQNVYYASGNPNSPINSYENSSTLLNRGAQYPSEPTSANPYVNQGALAYASVPHMSPGGNAPTSINAMQPPQVAGVAYRRPGKSGSRRIVIVVLGIVAVFCLLGILLVRIVLTSFNLPISITPTARAIAIVAPTPTAQAMPTPTPQPTPTPTLTPSESAQAVVQFYYSDINNLDFMDAYNQLSAASQKQQPYNEFVAGYSNTKHDDVTYEGTDPLDDGTYQCNVSLTATAVNASGVTITSTYTGYYMIGLDNGVLKILPGTKLLPA